MLQLVCKLVSVFILLMNICMLNIKEVTWWERHNTISHMTTLELVSAGRYLQYNRWLWQVKHWSAFFKCILFKGYRGRWYLWLQKDLQPQTMISLSLCKHFPAEFVVSITNFGSDWISSLGSFINFGQSRYQNAKDYPKCAHACVWQVIKAGLMGSWVNL